jgi:hypothetical protein
MEDHMTVENSARRFVPESLRLRIGRYSKDTQKRIVRAFKPLCPDVVSCNQFSSHGGSFRHCKKWDGECRYVRAFLGMVDHLLVFGMTGTRKSPFISRMAAVRYLGGLQRFIKRFKFEGWDFNGKIRDVYRSSDVFSKRERIQVTVYIDEKVLSWVDRVIEKGFYRCRSQLIETALREFKESFKFKFNSPHRGIEGWGKR